MNLIGRIFLFLLSLNFFFGNIPYLTDELSRLSGFLVLVVFSLSYPRKNYSKKSVVFWELCGYGVAILFIFTGGFFPAGVAAVLLILLLSQNEAHRRELSLFLSTLLFYTVFYYVDYSSPLIFQMLNRVALWYSAIVTTWSGTPMTLGPSALGMKISLSFFCLSMAFAPFIPNKRHAILALIMPFLANFLWLFAQKPLFVAVRFLTRSAEILPFHTQIFLILISALMLFPLIRKGVSQKYYGKIGGKKEWIGGVVATLLVAGVMILLMITPLGEMRSGTILFINRSADFEVPIYGKVYGKNAPGMFGILPHYLRLRGFTTKIVRENLTDVMLSNASAVVVFNPATGFSEKERERIQNFVERGGGLLVAGDHTDVNGIMKPINDLIRPFHIQLNFDTALPLKSGWAESFTLWNHPATRGLSAYHETGIWVGASLKISYPAVPLVAGKLGWADTGNYMNRKRAFLGDYKRSKEEPLGDLILAAESRLKKGTVIVFGDTSTFQNGIIPETSPFIDRIITSLLSKKTDLHQKPFCFVVALLILTGVLFIFPVYREPFVCLAMIAVLPLSFTLIQAMNQRFYKPFPFSRESFYSPALIDTSHMPKMTPLASADESVWGVTLNLMRNRMIPLYLKKLDSADLSRGKLLFMISPTQKVLEQEAGILMNYMKHGGAIIWAVGWEDSAPSADFLKRFHLSLDAVPLGSCEVSLEQMAVKFVDAWPIVTGDTSAQVLVKKWGRPIVVFQPVGKGGLLLIGDSEFLLSANMESYKTFNMNTIRFFGMLVRFLSKEAPMSVFREKEGAGE